MKVLVTSILALSILSMLSGYADELEDFCIVQDKDGYTNIRAKGALTSKITGRVDHGQLVWISLGGMTKWPQVIYMDKEGEEHTGFIHASRLKPLSDLENIPGKVLEKNQAETFKKGGLEVEITLAPFDKGKHELTYKEYEDGQRYLIKIDGLPYWGTDGGVPREQYRKISVQHKGKTTLLPDKAL